MNPLRRTLFLLLTLSITSGIASAQLATGLPPFTSFGGGADQINLANLNIHLAMPIISKAGRGLPLIYNLSFDSAIWTPAGSSGNQVWTPAANWGFTVGLSGWTGQVTANETSNCTYIPPPYNFELCTYGASNYAYRDGSGTLHTSTYSWYEVCEPGCSGGSSGSPLATDASGYTILPSANGVTDRSGNTIMTASGSLGTAGSIEDTNGNYLSANTSGSNTVITDTLGVNAVTLQPTNCTAPCTVIYTVPTGTVGITYYSYPVWTSFGCSGVTEFGPHSENLPYDIILPDGTAYVFIYESNSAHSGYYTGRIKEIGLPDGGTLSYTYSGGSNGINCSDGSTATLARTTPDGTWTYSHTPGQTTVTDPYGEQTVYTFDSNGHETSRKIYSGSASGAPLQTINTTWASNNTPATSTIILENGTTQSEIATTYNDYGVPTEVDQYGYGTGSPGPIVRKTTINYASFSNPIADLPSSITMKNAGGTSVAQTIYTYDSASLTSVTGIAQHDDTNYGVSQTTRGNPTEIQDWVAGSTFLNTYATYDTTGQHISDTDAKGNVTSYSFADNYFVDNGANPPQPYTPAKSTNAFVTTVVRPVLHTTYGYYFNTGKQAFATDYNGGSTYTHYDSFGRLTSMFLPPSYPYGAGWTLVQYPNGTEEDYYTGITDTTPSTSCSSCRHVQVLQDSLGRTSMNTLVNDPDGATTTQQQYDLMGRVVSVTNPYRSGNDPTFGRESYAYDALNRVTVTTHADNSVLSTYYGTLAVGAAGGASTQLCSASNYGLGTPVLEVDSAGDKQESWLDALNRVIEADEPGSNGSLTVPTCYLYDALGNLIEVVQGSETRSYAYDGLSRVTSEATPETGTTYLYYTTASGGLCSGDPVDICRKTDARGITTTDSYDSMNRLTSVSYSDGTPTVQYFYDQNSYNGLAIYNGVGRLTGMSDASGTSAYSYDQLGDVINENRTINGITKSLSYDYNLDGSVSGIVYPSGRSIGYVYSAAQRPIQATDDTDGTYIISQAHYAPQGALSFVNVGPTINFINEGFDYNNRLQMTDEGATINSSGTQIFDLQYGMPGSGSNNNEIQSVVNGLDNGRTTSVTYDTLNRLSTAHSQATSGPDCWGQSYGYDRWANLTSVNVTQCTGSSLALTVVNNQITDSGFTYDAGGDMTSDSQYSYTYDGAGRLSSANGVNYTYDGKNLRVEKSNGTIYWRGFSGDVFTETDLAGNVKNDFVYFDGSQVARVDASGNYYYYFTDKLNSTRIVTDSSGNVCYDADFTPFGREIDHVSSCPPEHKFGGYERDPESGLDYAAYRYYSSRLGRFMSPDPLKGGITKPQSLNRYTYVLNNPCNLVDPSGLCDVVAGGFTDNPGNVSQNMTQFADNIGANMAFPYSGLGDNIIGAANSFVHSDSDSTNQILSNAITDACSTGSCNLFLFSGAAQTFANIYPSLPASVQQNIGNVVYLSPGITGIGAGKLPTGSGQTVIYQGSTFGEETITRAADEYAQEVGIPITQFPDASCQGHSSGCAFNPANNLGQYKGKPCPNQKVYTRPDPNGVSSLAGAIGAPNIDIDFLGILAESQLWEMLEQEMFNFIDPMSAPPPVGCVTAAGSTVCYD